MLHTIIHSTYFRNIRRIAIPVLLLILLFSGYMLFGEETSDIVTFSRDVAPILQKNCQECHRPAKIAPFPLMTYDDAKIYAEYIQEAVENHIMPPWLAAEGYGEFKNERRLTDDEIKTISRWVQTGVPEGDPKDLPTPRTFPEKWFLGTPDIVVDPGEDFKVRKRGGDFFRSFVLPIDVKEDLWISAIEVMPGVPSVVHHVGIYADTKGESVKYDKSSPGIGYPGNMALSSFILLDFWTPGGFPRKLPQGLAWKLPAGSTLVMDIHYTPDDQVHFDRTEVGLYVAHGPIRKRVRFGTLGNTTFEIPPKESNYEVTASRRIPRDIHLISGWPHMHFLGREMKVWAEYEGGDIEPIIWVPEYDFHWQQVYELENPLPLPRGSRLHLQAFYNNTTSNPDNPYRKPRTIRYGQKARDEMCFFYFHYTLDEEDLSTGKTGGYDGIELRVGTNE